MRKIFQRNYNYCFALALGCIVALPMLPVAHYFSNVPEANKGSQMEMASYALDNGTNHELWFSPADITPANYGERREGFQNGSITVEIASLKFIRCLYSVDDCGSYSLLKSRFWYTSLTYQTNLPLGWSPSIPIAYRRLII